MNVNLDSETYDTFINNSRIHITEPVSFLEMIRLEKDADLVITDSGGVQKEAYFFKKPCVIMRSETEWKEIVEVGAAIIADADEEKIIEAYHHFKDNNSIEFPKIFGDGRAAEFICKELINNKTRS